jgi:hypothetical protein
VLLQVLVVKVILELFLMVLQAQVALGQQVVELAVRVVVQVTVSNLC